MFAAGKLIGIKHQDDEYKPFINHVSRAFLVILVAYSKATVDTV